MKTNKRKLKPRLGALLLSLCLILGLMPATVFAVQPVLTPGDTYRTTRTQAVVEFTSDTAGEYYYTAILPSEFPESGELEIDTTGDGVPCAAGETVSVTVDGLTTDSYLFFLVVKGGDGTESEVMAAQIPEWDWWTLGDDWILHIESNKGIENWNSWLESQSLLYQMLYKENVVGVNIWQDVSNVDGGSFPATEYPNLAAYTVEEGSKHYSTEDGVLYNESKTSLEAYPGAKADTDFAVPDTVKSIGYRAFYGNTKLRNITADELIVLTEAFKGSAVETLSANAVTRISEWAFSSCKNLTTFSVTGEESIFINMYAFENCTSLTDFPFEKIEPNNEGTGYDVFRGCTALTEIKNFPEVIYNRMFSNCTGLTEITIPSTVKAIKSDAFAGCTNLVSVTFESETPPSISTGISLFTPVKPNFRIHVPEGSENAYIEALGDDFAKYILDGEVLFYPLFVNGINVRSDNLTIPCGDGTTEFDPNTNTLTLTNATITEFGGEYGYLGAINSGLENLTIVLVGDNIINSGGDSINTAMACSLVIKGDGTLTTNSQLDLGREPSLIYDGNNDSGDLTIDGAEVNVGTYLFVHHNISFINGAKVDVTGNITANHQSTVTVDGADTSVTAKALSMGNGSLTDQTESILVINDGSFILRDGVSFPNPEDEDTNKYAIHFDPKEEGKIEINGGTFETKSDCKVTNALTENITLGDAVEVISGSWESGNLLISKETFTATLVPGKAPTCTEPGIKDYYIGSNGKYYEDEECTIEITDLDEWKIIPATGHIFEGGICTGCGVILGDVDHSGSLTISDATLIQIYLIRDLADDDVFDVTLADVNLNGVVTVTDATLIQLAISMNNSSRII